MTKPYWYEPPIEWRDDRIEERKMSNEQFERRVSGSVRAAAGEGNALRLSGHAALYNTLSSNLGGPGNPWYERILAKSFEGILATEPDVRLTLDHDAAKTLARTKAGSL